MVDLAVFAPLLQTYTHHARFELLRLSPHVFTAEILPHPNTLRGTGTPWQLQLNSSVPRKTELLKKSF